MKTLRKITLLLALVMLFAPILSACTQDEEDDEKIWWELGEEGRAATPDNLPEDLDYNGYEMQVYHRGGFLFFR